MNTEEYIKKAADRAIKWRSDTKLWLKDIFGDNIIELAKGMGIETRTETGLSLQQEGLFTQLTNLIVPRLKKHIGVKLTDEEKEYLNKIGISVQSGTGVGKDFSAALVAWYFLTVFKEVRVICTANTEKQLKNVLWNELKKVAKLSRQVDGVPIIEQNFNIQSERIEAKDKNLLNIAEAVTINIKSDPKDQAEALKGRHAKHMVIIIDEASGIKEGIKNAIEGTLTGLVNIIICIFNPTRSTGYAIETQKDNRYIALRWNAEESEIVVNKANHLQLLQKYGRESNPYRINVLGLPPISDKETFIPIDKIEAAIEREIEPLEDDPVIKGLDCGAGKDESVLANRKGGKITSLKYNNSADPMEVVGWVMADEYNLESDAIMGDIIGVGHGIVGRLREQLGSKVRSVDGRKKISNEENEGRVKFKRVRERNYWRMRDVFINDAISIPNDRRLIMNLMSLCGKYDSNGILQITTKKEVSEDVGESPNDVDAIANTFHMNDMCFRKMTSDDEDGIWSSKPVNRVREVEKSWMSV